MHKIEPTTAGTTYGAGRVAVSPATYDERMTAAAGRLGLAVYDLAA